MKALKISLDVQENILFLSKAFNADFVILDQENIVIFQTCEINLDKEALSSLTSTEGLGESFAETVTGLNAVKHPIFIEGHMIGSLVITLRRSLERMISSPLEHLIKCIEYLISASINNQKLEETSMLLENSMEIIHHGIIYTTDSGMIECHNRSAAQLFDTKKTLIGLDVRQFIGKLDVERVISNHATSRVFFTYEKKMHFVKGFYHVKRIQKSHSSRGFLFYFDEIDSYFPKNPESIKSQLTTTFDDIIGKSEKIQEVKDQVAKLGRGRSTILINGESGTGKELFARVIHFSSDRRGGPFIAINCAAIPDTLLESELFGYEEGAFTGAKKGGKPGKFELANNGTIFLDEIGDMKFSLQAKLLRVLQENAIERIGGKELIPINVRVVSATHEELHEKVENGSFRKDLFYRLSVIPIRIPSLRDRKQDILIIARVFLERFNQSMRKNISDFDDTVKNCLLNYLWSGNVRELENVVEYAVNMTTTNLINMEDLPVRFNDATHRDKSLFKPEAISAIVPIEELEKKEIQKALEFYGKSKKDITQAAAALGISVSTLYRRIRLHDLNN